MEHEKVLESVKKAIAECLNLHPEQYKLEDTFIELGAGSLDIVEIGITVEDDLAVELPDPDLNKILTVNDFVKYIEQHV